MTMRWTAAAGIAAALAGGVARAQDGAPPAPETSVETSAEAAEEAFLRAWFRERELKDFAAAEKAYAAVANTEGAPREVIGRALVGRARCLRALGQDEEAGALLGRVERGFADVPEVMKDARAARQRGAGEATTSLEMRIRESLARPTETEWRETAKFGARGVPVLAELLGDDSPQVVFRAAACLAVIDDPVAAAAAVEGLVPSTYPEQVRAGLQTGLESGATRRRLLNSSDEALRRYALGRALYDWADPTAIEAVLAEPGFAMEILRAPRFTEQYGKFLLAAIARGGAFRTSALDALRNMADADHPMMSSVGSALSDPPPEILRDAEAVATIVETSSAHIHQPSDTLVETMLGIPRTQAIGVRHALARGRPDVDRFIAAVARVGFGEWKLLPQDQEFARALLRLLGPRPSPERLRMLASAWPPIRITPHDLNRFSVFIDRLLRSDVVDENGILALQEGLRVAEYEQALLGALGNGPHAGRAVQPWAKRVFLRTLAQSDSESLRATAAWGLMTLQEALGEGAGLTADIPAIVGAMGGGGSAHLVQVLKGLGTPGLEALRNALPSHAHPDVIVDGLLEIGDAASAPAIAEKLRAPKDEDLATSAAKALVKFRGDAAKDDLAAAIRADGGRFAQAVLSEIEPLSAPVRRDLMLVALAHASGVAMEAFAGTGDLALDDARRIVLAALASKSGRDRRWGARQAKGLLDFALWDALVAAAQDADAGVREDVREALRAIRDKETELAAFRAMGRERQTRERIEKLLASNLPRDRRAGVAAIAATGLAGLVDELIRLAAEDPDPEVADDARKALLAMARAPSTGAPSGPKGDDGGK